MNDHDNVLIVRKDVFDSFPIPDDLDQFNIYKGFILNCLSLRENKYFNHSDCHHILPVCLGGLDEGNRIFLSYREHYLAHHYLAMAYFMNYELLFTINMMSSLNKYGTLEERANTYSESKKYYIEACRERMTGDNNPMRNPIIAAKLSGDNNSSKREEVKEKIRLATMKNLDYIREATREAKEGRIWVNNGIDMKQIYPENLDEYILKGYTNKGMIRTKHLVSKDYDCTCKYCGKSYKGGKYSTCCKNCYSKIHRK